VVKHHQLLATVAAKAGKADRGFIITNQKARPLIRISKLIAVRVSPYAAVAAILVISKNKKADALIRVSAFKTRCYMKAIFLCCTLAAFFSVTRSEVLIRGRIKDIGHSKVTILEPINGFSNGWISRPEFVTRVNQDGHFEKLIKLEFPTMITITIGIRPIWVFVEPGDTVTIDIDAGRLRADSLRGSIQIEGKNGIGNTFYNTFNYNPKEKFDEFEHLLDSMNFRHTLNLEAVDHALSMIIRPFDSLLLDKKITNTFYDVVVNDTRNVLLTHPIRFAFHDKGVTQEQAIAFFDQVYSRYPLTRQAIRGGLYGTIPCYDYYFIKARKIFPNAHLPDSILIVNGKSVFVKNDLVPLLYVPVDLRESLYALELVSLNKLFAEAYGKREVETFLTLFPNSRMRPYLAPPFFNLTAGPTSFGDSSGYVFTPAEKINSFDSLLTKFRGKRLLIDLWATWCVPCKMEFGYNGPIDSFCRRHDVVRLYVAFERGPTRNNVRRNVYAYNLKGDHVIANDTLINDITDRIFPTGGGYVIPHYVLVDEKGDIVEKNAPRPSSETELLARMKTVFDLTDY
jgi:thiol-disulfide isomerase/thioredoxin